MYPILFEFGPLTIYTYGFFVFLGVVCGYWLAVRAAIREEIDRDIFSHIAFWVILSAFLGAKLLYIVVEFELFLNDPLSTIRSGFVFYGGILAGFVFSVVLTAIHRISFFRFADSASIGIPLGHALGRIGCYFYGCCYGISIDSPYCILFPPDSPAGLLGERVIPTQLISAFFLCVLFLALLCIQWKKKFHGQVFLAYLILYGVFRFIIEFFRADPRGEILSLSTSQAISVVLVGLGFFLWRKRRTMA
ncbi:MAG: prolipoprotein diacylglyceryl transferase [Candidatus Omnitrophota bacterium]|nr:MAG: prolipoprotein diacylglyceryl transferase [Candidatus Omnitrophota bacterium]